MKKEIKNIIENLGWDIYEDKYDIDIRKFSPLGEDFGFSINNSANMVEDIIEYAEDFDEEEHYTPLIEMKGTHGIPNSIRDLLNDAHDIKLMLLELATELKNYKTPKTNNKTLKAIQRLAKDIQKKALKDKRESLAGAIYNGKDTYMCDGYRLFVAYDEEIKDLPKPTEYRDLQYNKLFKNNKNLEEIQIDYNKVKNALKNNEQEITLDNGQVYNTKWLKLMLDCFTEPKVYADQHFLQIEEDNKKAIIMKIRKGDIK